MIATPFVLPEIQYICYVDRVDGEIAVVQKCLNCSIEISKTDPCLQCQNEYNTIFVGSPEEKGLKCNVCSGTRPKIFHYKNGNYYCDEECMDRYDKGLQGQIKKNYRRFLFNMFIVFINAFFAMHVIMRFDYYPIYPVGFNTVLLLTDMIFYVLFLVMASDNMSKLGQYKRTGRF